MNEKFYINIGRQLGSGGHKVGRIIADDLKIPFFDKELIELASQKSELHKDFFEKANEKTTHSLFGGLGLSTAINDIFTTNYLCNEKLFQIQSDVIKELSEKSSCLFIGRCTDYVLRNKSHCLNLFVSANPQDRINRIVKSQNIPENKAKEIIEKADKKRSEYYNFFSGKIWGAAESYHFTINTSLLGIEKTAKCIENIAKQYVTCL